jgi:hypothetical protein
MPVSSRFTFLASTKIIGGRSGEISCLNGCSSCFILASSVRSFALLASCTFWLIYISLWLSSFACAFNLIAIAQSILLAAVSLPYQNVLLTPRSAQSGSTWLPSNMNLGWTDFLLAGLTLLDLYIQFMADNQQYSYQTYKHSLKPQTTNPDSSKPATSASPLNKDKQGPFDITWTAKDAQRGFITQGLWAWSRHPNFAAEMTFWGLQGLFPTLANGGKFGGRSLTMREKEGMVLLHPLLPAIAVSRSGSHYGLILWLDSITNTSTTCDSTPACSLLRHGSPRASPALK